MGVDMIQEASPPHAPLLPTTHTLWPWEERWSREEWAELPELAGAPTLSWPHFLSCSCLSQLLLSLSLSLQVSYVAFEPWQHSSTGFHFTVLERCGKKKKIPWRITSPSPGSSELIQSLQKYLLVERLCKYPAHCIPCPLSICVLNNSLIFFFFFLRKSQAAKLKWLSYAQSCSYSNISWWDVMQYTASENSAEVA